MRVLVADDCYEDRVLFRRCLSGHEVIEVSSGSDAAVEFYRATDEEQPFDLVISDVSMLGGTGWMLAKEIREHDQKTPVILVTGSDYLARTHAKYVDAIFVDKGLDCGCEEIQRIIQTMEGKA